MLDLIAAQSKATGRAIGIYPETKNPTFFRDMGLPMEDKPSRCSTGPASTARVRRNAHGPGLPPIYLERGPPSKITLMHPTLIACPFHRERWVFEETDDTWRTLALNGRVDTAGPLA